MSGHRCRCRNPGETPTGARNGTPGGRRKPVKYKRVYPGYYEAETYMKLNGKPTRVYVEIQRFDEWAGSKWSSQISRADRKHVPLLDFSDGYGPWTYREAKESVEQTLARGLTRAPFEGWCLAPT